MVGSTVSHYRILAKLGEGGMGVVYKAEDLKLQRTVALKFLPHHLSATHEDQERFLQEARAASALNHPHVCTIYAIEEDGDEAFIAMEYVEGKTLRAKIEEPLKGTGPGITQDHAISYAIQIAEALQEAHCHGIIHRDVKADNIMVNTKDQIKVMDFGLAKLKGSLKLAQTTSTVGTLSYMAPEQIQQATVDARSDLFSVGVVLYEMLTGRLPFRGEHEAAMMYSILNEEPEPIQRFLPDISSELVHILNRALEKDPEDRYQSAHDMAIDLRRLKKQSTRVVRQAGVGFPAGAAAADTAPSKAAPSEAGALVDGSVLPRPHKFWLIAAGVTLVAAAIALSLLLSRGGPHLNPEMKFHVVQTPLRNVWYGNLSSDGNWMICSASDGRGKYDVYMINIASGQPRRVTTDSCVYINGVDLSPDGSTIAFARGRSAASFAIVTAPSVGGTSKEIAEEGYAPGWLPDGKRIAYLSGRRLPGGRRSVELWSCHSDGSDKKCEFADTIRNVPGFRSAYSFSPDCRSIAWTRSGDGWSDIVVRDLATGHEVQLTNDRTYADDPLWLPNGYIVFSSTRGGNCNLWATPAEGGDLIQVTRGSGPDAPCGYSSSLNRLVYVEMQSVGHIKVVDLASGSVQQLTIDDRGRGYPSISDDGRYVAFAEQGVDATSAKSNIALVDRQAGTIRKLTDDDEVKGRLAISPDAAWLLYCSRRASETAESTRVFLLSIRNPGQRRLLGFGSRAAWLNNSEFVLWQGLSSLYRGSIDKQTLERSGPDSTASIPIGGDRYTLVWDYRASQSGVWVKPGSTTSSGAPERAGYQLLKGRIVGAEIAWRSNMLFYRLPGSDRLQIMSLPDGKSVQSRTLPPGDFGAFGVRPDGRELVYTDASTRTRYVAIEGFLK